MKNTFSKVIPGTTILVTAKTRGIDDEREKEKVFNNEMK